MDEKVAVIGGTGFLGSNLVVELLKAGYAPVVVARRPGKVAEVLPGVPVETRWGDLTDFDSLCSALQGCDAVHCVAALMSQVFTGSGSDLRAAAVRTNVEGTLNALRAAREVGARRVVVTGTAVARYQRDGALVNEDSPPPDSKVLDDAYVRSKLLAEAATADFARETGLDVVSILPGGIVGPRDASPTPLGEFLVKCLNGRAPVSIGGAFPIVDVRDVARAHVAAIERGAPGASYLVVARTVSLREWHDVLTRLTGLPGPRIVIPASMAVALAHLAELLARVTRGVPLFTRNQVRHIVQGQRYGCSRARRELGITFTSIETALQDAILWYVENGWVSRPERLINVNASLHFDCDGSAAGTGGSVTGVGDNADGRMWSVGLRTTEHGTQRTMARRRLI